MSDKLQFYFAPGTCSLASLIALEDVQVSYEAHRLSFELKEQSSEAFLKVNPKGRVPALVTPNGVLTETPAILAFIAQSYPEAKLAPLDDPFAFAKLQEFNSYLVSTLHVAHAHRMRGHRWVDDADAIRAMQAKVPTTVADGFRYVEDNYLDGPFVLGDTYTVADGYLFTLAQWMEGDGVDAAQFPKVSAHSEMMRQRESVCAALRKEQG